MKLKILNQEGKKVKEIDSGLFSEAVREDIIRKVVEAEKIWHPYSNKFRAGMDRSASGNVGHRRHDWKSDRGRGQSRVPKKTAWRRGTQFSWEGAIVPSTRGGRRAHPPKGYVNLKKINKKEFKKALLSALSYVADVGAVKEKYSSLDGKDIKVELPLVVDGKVAGLKIREFDDFLQKVLGDWIGVGLKKKSVRAGRGKIRGRRIRKSAGLLFVVGKDEDCKSNEIDVVKVNDLIVSDLASNGARLVMFSEKAIEGLGSYFEGVKGEKKVKEKKVDKRKLKKEGRKKKVKKVNKKGVKEE